MVKKVMSTDDLKHALISLVIGILTMVSMELVNGIIRILQDWIVAGASGTAASVSYLVQRYRA